MKISDKAMSMFMHFNSVVNAGCAGYGAYHLAMAFIPAASLDLKMAIAGGISGIAGLSTFFAGRSQARSFDSDTVVGIDGEGGAKKTEESPSVGPAL